MHVVSPRSTLIAAAIALLPCLAFAQGDASKAVQQLGWMPRTSFEELIRMMVQHDLEDLSGAPAPAGREPAR